MAYIYSKKDIDAGLNFLGHCMTVPTDETEVIVSNEVTVLPDRCFSNCFWMTNITIPDSVTHLGLEVFKGCTDLTDIKISKQIKVIHYGTFSRCVSLNKLVLPSVERFSGSKIFSCCSSLRAVVAPNMNLDEVSSEYKKLLVGGFVDSPELFSDETEAKYKKYIISQKSSLAALWIKQDYVAGIKYLAENGAITIKNYDSLYFSPAVEAKAQQCVSYLLDWKNKNISFEDEMRHIEKELNRKPTEISLFKKSWEYDVFSDNTMALTSYLGDYTEDIFIPEKVGKYTVWRLNKHVFSIFVDDNDTIRIHVPKSVTEIRRQAFNITTIDGDPALIICAPTGSYAEQYAKENNIPFIAE